MTQPKIAIITRTKDRPTFLRRALQSVYSQTYQDYLHVIYNDGGDIEKVNEIIASLPEEKRSRIRVKHSSGSGGKRDTILNDAVAVGDSKYIAVHDDDDTWHPNFLTLTLDFLEENNLEGVVARTDKIVEELLPNGEIKQKKIQRWMPDVSNIGLYRQCVDNQTATIAFVYSRKAYKEIGGYDDQFSVCGDWEFGIRFLLRYDVGFVDPGYSLAFYHQRARKTGREGNTSISNTSEFDYYTNLLLNKYLRAELSEGRLGVGYIMNNLRYNQRYAASLLKRLLPSRLVSRIKHRVAL